MSEKYDNYIEEHQNNVEKAYEWFKDNLEEIFSEDVNLLNMCEETIYRHDQSKLYPDEYIAYDRYFYGNNKSHEVVEDFNRAWLTHIHRNPHHWQHWILINDNPDEGEILLDMPDVYIIEMICDWWSFSFKKGNLKEIFAWYDEHKKYMKLSNKTRNKVEEILDQIRVKLAEA